MSFSANGPGERWTVTLISSGGMGRVWLAAAAIAVAVPFVIVARPTLALVTKLKPPEDRARPQRRLAHA